MEFLTCKIRSSKNINSFKHKYIEHLKEAYANIDHFQSTCKLFSISTELYNHIFITIGPLHDPFTWYKITHASEQVALPLFWKSHCSTGPTACVILYHVTGSCEWGMKQLQVNSVYLSFDTSTTVSLVNRENFLRSVRICTLFWLSLWLPLPLSV